MAIQIGEVEALFRYPVKSMRGEALRSEAFQEDSWVGGLLSFGEGDQAASTGVTNPDERCSMINFDPDSARAAPELLKAVVRERDNKVGVYGTVMRRGPLAVGQPIFFERQ
jgi:uncharacterized protein YcbX